MRSISLVARFLTNIRYSCITLSKGCCHDTRIRCVETNSTRAELQNVLNLLLHLVIPSYACTCVLKLTLNSTAKFSRVQDIAMQITCTGQVREEDGHKVYLQKLGSEMDTCPQRDCCCSYLVSVMFT